MLLMNRYPSNAVIALSIGILASTLQPVRAQSTAAELSQIDTGDAKLARWVSTQSQLKAAGWQLIWQRFHGMGECGERFVASRLLEENHPELRLVLTGAYLLVTRSHQTTLLDRRIAERHHRDRIMSMFALSLGPRQAGDGRVLVRWLKRAKTPLEQIAGCLALARCEEPGSLPDRVVGKAKDIGVLAAALYCQPAQGVAWIKTRVAQLRGHQEHAHLVWRGYLLGEKSSKPADKDRRQLALQILQDADRTVLPEAAYFLAHDGEVSLLDEDILDQPLAIKLQLAALPKFRVRLLRNVDIRIRGTTSDILSRRWWSLFIRFAPIHAVVKALEEWQAVAHFKRDQALRTSIGLALAWRLFASSAEAVDALDLEITPLIDTPAGAWLQLALGRARTASISHQGFADLARAYPLAVDNRLPRMRIADLLESALWREGGHPARAGIDLHRQLQAELMIDGKEEFVGSFDRAQGFQPYKAKGPPDQSLFLVATQLFRFIRREEPWSMKELRSEK